MSVRVIVSFNVKNNMQLAFVTLMDSVKEDLPNVEGCLGVDIYRSLSSLNRFTLVEEWQTQALHQKHLAKLSDDGTWEFISGHLSENPESDYFSHM